MADKKISQLNALPAFADGDLDAVVDLTDNTTKKATALLRAQHNADTTLTGLLTTAKSLIGGINEVRGVIVTSNQYMMWVDGTKGNDTTGTGSFEYPYKTIQKAADTIGNPTSTAEAREPWEINISPGYYDENVSLPAGRWIKLISHGAVTLGDSDVPSVPRNVTINIDSTKEYGGLRPLYVFACNAACQPDTARPAKISSFNISGNLTITSNAGVQSQADVALDGVKISGTYQLVDGTTTVGDSRLYAQCSFFDNNTTSISDAAATGNILINELFCCETDGAIICGRIEAARFCDLNDDITVTAVPAGESYPAGFYDCDFHSHTFTGVASSFIYNASCQNLPTLAGGATAVLITDSASVKYDNAGSTLSATDVEAALDELDGKILASDSWNEVMHIGNSFTIANNENLSAIINQNDTTNNPPALIINNTGSGYDIQLPNAYLKNGTFSFVNLIMSGTVDPANPLAYSSDPILTPGSNQFATMKSLHPTLEPVLDFVDFTTSEPGSPSHGDRYINTATGVSSGTAQSVTANYIYEWNNTDWTETVPTGGDKVFDDDSGKFYIYTGSGWAVDHASLAQLQFVSGAKAGNDANGAASWDDPVLTLGQMITTASGKTPASDNIISIRIIDGGEYDGSSDTLPSYCNLFAENAKLTVGVGVLSLSDNSNVTFGSAEKTDASYLIRKIAGTDETSIHFLGKVDLNSHQFLYLSNSKLNVDFETIKTTGADEPVTFNVLGTTSVLNTRGKELENTDATAYALYAESTSKIYADINRILAPNNYWLYLAGNSRACVRALETTGDVYTAAGAKCDYDILRNADGDHEMRQDSGNIKMIAGTGKNVTANRLLSTGALAGLGDRKGFVISYSSTTAVAISAGWIEANGELYTLASAATHNMTSLASGYDHHYIYIDDDVSSAPTATIIDSTTEPSWSDAKLGWYNGDDLCIGSVVSPSGSATIATFDTLVLSGNVIKYNIRARTNMLQMASNMTPAGLWQTPDDNDGSVVTPVMATAISMDISYGKAANSCAAYAASSEFAALEAAVANAPFRSVGYNGSSDIAEIILGASRNVKIAGTAGDDSVLTVYCTGYTIYR